MFWSFCCNSWIVFFIQLDRIFSSDNSRTERTQLNKFCSSTLLLQRLFRIQSPCSPFHSTTWLNFSSLSTDTYNTSNRSGHVYVFRKNIPMIFPCICSRFLITFHTFGMCISFLTPCSSFWQLLCSLTYFTGDDTCLRNRWTLTFYFWKIYWCTSPVFPSPTFFLRNQISSIDK